MTVIPAQAGTQRRSWVPAFAGMTIFALLLLFLAAPALALAFPKLSGRVVDEAHLLNPAQTLDIGSKLAALEARTGRQLVVATVPSLQGETIESYGYQLGRAWGIGTKGMDDGVILLVAPNERKVRIETGYGARVFLTDAVSSVIVRESILPRFKAGDFGGGIGAGVDQIITMMELPPAEAAKRAGDIAQRERARADDGVDPMAVVFIVLLFFFVVLPLMRAFAGGGRGGRRGRRGGAPIIIWGPGLGGSSWNGGSSWGGGGSGWGGGSSWGGGGFSGGGGSFGGGGASGGW